MTSLNCDILSLQLITFISSFLGSLINAGKFENKFHPLGSLVNGSSVEPRVTKINPPEHLTVLGAERFSKINSRSYDECVVTALMCVAAALYYCFNFFVCPQKSAISIS